jgi:hypothetical protein
MDELLESELIRQPNVTNFDRSKRIIAATNLKPNGAQRSSCSRLVPFLQYANKLFLTTPNYYPHFIELLAARTNFGNELRAQQIEYLEYHALRLSIGNVPVWTDNHELNATYKTYLFQRYIEPDWQKQIDAFIRRSTR